MNLQQLQALMAVARLGSISAAARQLGIAQPALSRMLKQLERSVDAPLLHRNAHGAVVTEFGKVLVARASAIDTEVHKALDEINQLQNRRSGRVAVACSPVPLMFVLPTAMAIFREQYPRVEVYVREDVFPQVASALREGQIDFAIGPTPHPGPGRDFETAKLFSIEIVAAVRRGHPRQNARSISELADSQWIIAGPPQGPGAIIEPLFRKHAVAPPFCPVHMESIFSAVETIKRSELVGLLPLPVAQAAGDALKIVPLKEKVPVQNVNVIFVARTILTPAAKALVSAIRTASSRWRTP